MKIQVDFLSLPKITKIVGSKTISFDLQGNTIIDLINEMSNKYGEEINQFLLDESGKLDTVFKIMINKKQWISRHRMNTSLKEGDRATFMMLVGGG